jgi:anti-anti-sigma regulatory factor
MLTTRFASIAAGENRTAVLTSDRRRRPTVSSEAGPNPAASANRAPRWSHAQNKNCALPRVASPACIDRPIAHMSDAASTSDAGPHRPDAAGADPTVRVRAGLGRAPHNASLVTLSGEHDYGSAGALREALRPLHGHLLVDLSDCRLIDTASINVILTKHRSLALDGFILELLIPPARVHLTRVFDLLGIQNLMTIHEQPPFPI